MFQEPTVDQAFEPSFRRSAYLFAVEFPGKTICFAAGLGMKDEMDLPFVRKESPRLKSAINLLRLIGVIGGVGLTMGLNELAHLPKHFWYNLTSQNYGRFVEPMIEGRPSAGLPYYRRCTLEEKFTVLQH
ncbi:MAG: hypothetical protein QF486_00695 [Candidatus Woesearchaeota archaeon]|jgi:hypothetical protein|nr:hypothetical protein [Candidatus Woesearchaeota archaeon]MDP7181262.1 hypothetical protein [Candidatus Woesearchaeota archaeon]MDP7198119.1 hypothetical protein [Candidatus Woesearchaeota archaeon]MDP7466953.1 hypothetical protein [Candidatus Woesearchaeota archaeon]MDP7646961.1 hypothetical protein [Candidatus Woesearchaeota archaeon]